PIEFSPIVKSLIEAGADPNTINNSGNGSCPLHFAAEAGDVDLIDFLLEHGANIESEGMENVTPLYFACKNGHEKAAVRLIEWWGKFEPPWSYYHTPMTVACKYGHLNVVTRLIELGANIEAENGYGATALFVASEHGQQEILAYLIKSGANINNIRTYQQKTALDIALERQKENVVLFLLENGANPLNTRVNFLKKISEHGWWLTPKPTEPNLPSFFDRVYLFPQRQYLYLLNRSSLFRILPREIRLRIIRWVLAPWTIQNE
ncbi:MAG TPA: ankyrin repeat domain-containing protein, partial [Myxococcota bacterium]|nr:ankyrin repeat domain-containing protein [Myxococcota bacterium]